MFIRKLFFCLSIAAVFLCADTSAQTKKVHFLVKADTAGGVAPVFSLAGSMNNWNPADSNYRFTQSGGAYELTVKLPPGRYEYKLTRGSWPTVETSAGGTPVSNR